MTRFGRRTMIQGLAATTLMVAASPALAQSAGENAWLYAIVYSAGPNWRAGVPMEEQGLREHFYYIRDLHARGVIVLAGPRGPQGGLILLRAADQGQADAVMSADPAVTTGIFVGEATLFTSRFTNIEALGAALSSGDQR